MNLGPHLPTHLENGCLILKSGANPTTSGLDRTNNVSALSPPGGGAKIAQGKTRG